jgi:hypothetical protein
MTPQPDEGRLRLYLLGLLPEDEAHALEEEYFARPEVLERVRAGEDDLLDDYAAGRLDPDERAAFEGRYLASPVLRPRVLAARALRLASRSDAAVPARRTIAWRAPVAIAAGLLLALLALRLWPPAPRGEARASPAATGSPPPEELPAATPSPEASRGPSPVPATPRLVFALAAVRVRGEAATPELRLPAGPATVVLELEGDPSLLPSGSSGLTATIHTVEGDRVWSGAAPRRRARGRPALVAAVEVPGQALPPGDYIVALSTAGPAGGILHRYFFRVRVGS